MGFVTDVIDSLTGKTAGDASREAAGVQAGSQEEVLDFLKEREALPREFSEGALQTLGGLFGLGDISPRKAIRSIEQSPLFGAILGQREAGEEAILRNASATGGLRSGNVQDALAGFNIDLENQALMQGISGLQGLANLPTQTQNIANTMSGIGQTQAQGILGEAQTRQAAVGNLANLGLGAASLAFSDVRLKDNVREIGEKNGHKWYAWDWNEEAEQLGLSGPDEGVMAHEVAVHAPEAVYTRDNYLVVDYSALGVQ